MKLTPVPDRDGSELDFVEAAAQARALLANVEKVVVGKREAVELALATLFARGHLLIEDVPGVGKTTLAQALARSVEVDFARIQATSDLLPSDVVGVAIYSRKEEAFEFREGPIFTNILLVDEINRAMPRTQSALLQAMAEGEVTVDGTTYAMRNPFMVMATQNPAEQVGTYFLPESQLDRFALRITLGYPDRGQEREMILARQTGSPIDDLTPCLSPRELRGIQDVAASIKVEEAVLEYMLDIVERTRKRDDLSAGVSPRGALGLFKVSQAFALVMGRDHVIPDDIKRLAPSALAHRLTSRTGFRGGLESQYGLVEEILEQVAAP